MADRLVKIPFNKLVYGVYFKFLLIEWYVDVLKIDKLSDFLVVSINKADVCAENLIEEFIVYDHDSEIESNNSSDEAQCIQNDPKNQSKDGTWGVMKQSKYVVLFLIMDKEWKFHQKLLIVLYFQNQHEFTNYWNINIYGL